MKSTKRVVKRTYYSKKAGKYVTREYTYRSGKSTTLVKKGGKVNQEAIDRVKAEIDARDDLSPLEKKYAKNDLDDLVWIRSKNKKKLTENGFWGKQSENDIDRLLANLGTDADELADLYGISTSEIYDEDNWTSDTFTAGGVIYAINFTYNLQNALIPI